MAEIRSRIAGEVRDDALYRALYSTDASIYEIVPDGVVLPRSVEDVVHAVQACGQHGVPITPRGAGTGLAGGTVNRGLQLDCSRHLNRVLDVNVVARTAHVEAGVVLDELNAVIRPHGLHFAPDVATSSRATIGGMIANNSCGARSVIYGRTVDHVLALDVVLSDGSRWRWGKDKRAKSEKRNIKDGRGGHSLAAECDRVLSEIIRDYADEIAARYPRILRQNGGYALDRLRVEDGRINTEAMICGSEGTLAIVVGALLKLTPLPKCCGMLIVHFDDLLDALAATPIILQHGPAAVELIDRLILDAAMSQPAMAARAAAVEGRPAALLVIELHAEDAISLGRRLDYLADDLRDRKIGYARRILRESGEQAKIWDLRKSGLGLLMSKPGDRQTYDFVEDTAVDPARLRDYIARFMKVLEEEGVAESSYYAHASVGCLHVKPILNLKSAGDIQKMYRIADRISSLALEFGGTMTGEHGDGILRSCWLEKMYGSRLIEAFRKIKQTFDPLGILNPGKIVDSLPMTESLRYGPAYAPSQRTEQLDTMLDFSSHGGMLGLTEMCSGVGQCRQKLVGTMCPSYMATNDEQHTTRGRANALRLALSNRNLITGLNDPALDEVMDLCLSCKACKTECPTGVDMARLKAEWQWQRYKGGAVPLRNRLIASMPKLARWGAKWPSLANMFMQSGMVRAAMERVYGFDCRVAPPRFAKQTFWQWWKKHSRERARAENIHSAGRSSVSALRAEIKNTEFVVYFVDTWTNYYAPQVGIAAVTVLEALGYDIIIPSTVCCGRPAISKGMLDVARRLTEQNVSILSPYAESDIPIVGTEPSCILTFGDEAPQLVRSSQARRIAECAVTIETFLARHLRANPGVFSRSPSAGTADATAEILYHGHCHQKALTGTADAMFVLRAASGGRASEINSGCCGMAGSFGHEKEHYDVARAIGEQRLFPAIRARGTAQIAISGFSCRHQIEHHTETQPKYLIEIVAEGLAHARRIY